MKPKMRHPIKAARHNSNSKDTRSTCETHSLSPILANTPQIVARSKWLSTSLGQGLGVSLEIMAYAWTWWERGTRYAGVLYPPTQRLHGKCRWTSNSCHSCRLYMIVCWEYPWKPDTVMSPRRHIHDSRQLWDFTFFPTTRSSDHEHVAHLVVQGFTETSWTLKLLYNLNTISHLYGDLYTILLLIIMPNHASAGWHIKAKLCFIQIMCCFADFKHARILDLLHYVSNTWSFFQRASSNIGRVGRCELPIWHQDTLACWPCQFPETRSWVVQDLTCIALDD